MPNFVFALKVEGTVRVRAPDEMAARKVVPAVLLLPGPDEVRMANDSNAKFGWDGTITSVNFRLKGASHWSARAARKSDSEGGVPRLCLGSRPTRRLLDTTTQACRPQS